MRMSDAAVGRTAWFAAWTGLVLAPVHALARFATEDGKADLDSAVVRAWAEPARERLLPLLDWADPDTVYLTYGKLFFPILLAATLCAFAVRRRRAQARGAEMWGWRIASVGYVVLTAATVGEYWTPYLDEAFAILAIPGLLLSVIGSTVLGIGLLRRRFQPRLSAWLLAGWLPLVVLLSAVVALGAALLPMLFAWALAGRRLLLAESAGGTDVRLGLPDALSGTTKKR